jgi:predicted Zn-dependent protease
MERKIRANLAYGAGKYLEAEDHLLTYLHDYPFDSTAWQMLANTRLKLGKKELTQTALEMVKMIEGTVQ